MGGKRRLKRLFSHALDLLGLQVKSKGSDFDSFMLTTDYARRLREELCSVVYEFVSNELKLKPCTRQELQDIVDEFFKIYPKRPVVENVGGSGFHNCFWLYVISRYLNPSLIVESGVLKGQTAWIFAQACPGATIHCFDIDLRRLVYKSESINWHEMDWGEFKFESVDPKNSLCFFDDHINQAKRVREAYDKGFRILIFDDNPPAHKIYSFGKPGVPTIDMLLDNNVEPGVLMEWIYKGARKSYLHKGDQYSARQVIQEYVVFPDVASVTKYGSHAFLSLVKLVD